MSNRRLFRSVGCFTLLAILVALALAQEGAADDRLLRLEDRDNIHSLGAPRISPDGEQIAYTLDDQVFIVATSDAEPRLVTSAESTASSPHWSADGNFLYFLSERDNLSQLWRMPVNNFSEPEQVTDLEHSVSTLKLSPDETKLLLTFSNNELQEDPEDAEPKPIVVTRRQFKVDAGDGYIREGDSNHLYVYDIEKESLTQITSGAYEETSGAWSPNGESIVFISNRDDPDANYTTDLWLVAADNEDEGQNLKRLTDNPDTKQSPAWSPDGDLIAYITAVDGVYGLQHLAVIPSSGGEPKVLTTELDRFIWSFEFSSDGDWIYFRYDDSGASKLARVRIRDNRIETLIEGERAVRSFDVGESGDIAVAAAERNYPGNIYRFNNGELAKLTALNAAILNKVDLGNKIKVSFESTDDTIVHAFITTPPGYESGRAYPAILKIHGGPVGQFSWGFTFNTQFYASNGYVVIEPNPRGSTGSGQDFIDAIYRTWGFEDYDDVIAAVDFAVEQGIADPDKLAVTGYSYGGYMTNVVITRTNRFKAAASGAGHSLIEANFGHDIYQQWYMWETGAPWEHRERYDVLSPFLQAGRVETPTIFLGGRIDWNVPILNAELFYQALQVRGIDSQLVVYPETHHSGWSAEFEKDYMKRVVDWFDKYVQ